LPGPVGADFASHAGFVNLNLANLGWRFSGDSPDMVA
jgi:hypothetical protein